MKQEIWTISKKEKKIISSLLRKGRREQKENDQFATIEFDDLYQLFNSEEIAVIKKFLEINPKEIGYDLPFVGFKLPTELTSIPNQTFTRDGRSEIIPCPYIPNKVFVAYKSMNEAMQKDIHKKLLVSHGYRSPARQVFLFFDHLERRDNFDFDKTISRVCFPDYSEHVCSKRQAVDFNTLEGIKGDDFASTEEYRWLQKNANQFGFYESYPQDNKLNMAYEPWHWHYELNE